MFTISAFVDALTLEEVGTDRYRADSLSSTHGVVFGGQLLAQSVMAGLAGHAPIPFNLGVSNVPGPPEPLYFNGSRLDALFPLSLLLHGNALNITCVSYAGTLNFGFTGARDTLPHLQHLAIYMGESLKEIERILLGKARATKAGRPRRSRTSRAG